MGVSARTVVSNFVRPCGLYPTSLFCPWNFLCKRSGLPFTTPGDIPNSRIEPASPGFAGRFSTTEPPHCNYRNRFLKTLLNV